MSDQPIYRLNQDRKDFIEHVVQLVLQENHLDMHAHPKVYRYTQQICAQFSSPLYYIAQKTLMHFLRWGLGGIFNNKAFLDCVDIQNIPSWDPHATFVIVPIHQSNLDSLLIACSIFQAGFPPFLYGAGLNLFSHPVRSFFMRHLGSYTIDRSNQDLLYKMTLKMYSRVALEKGLHSVFFPEGRRTRSGAVESKLKLGLLNSAVQAQRCVYPSRKIIIIPVVLAYPWVMEAPSLIMEHLKLPQLKGALSARLQASEKIVIRFCQPLDVQGELFVENKSLSFSDAERSVMVLKLEKSILQQYSQNMPIFNLYIVCFCLYRLLGEPKVNWCDTSKTVSLEQFWNAIQVWEKASFLCYGSQKWQAFIEQGLERCMKSPQVILKIENQIIHVLHLPLIYYYHNKTQGILSYYGLL